jgi:kynureninase
MSTALSRAAALDAADPLAAFRQEFELPVSDRGEPQIYLCGNSLGPLPRAARDRVNQVIDDWARRAVRGHHDGPRPWLDSHVPFSAPLAELVGAQAADVVLMNSLTVNLHLLLVSFYRPDDRRSAVLIERGAFPSDHYAIESQIRLHGLDPEQCLVYAEPRPGEDLLRTEDIEALIERHGARLALVLLPGVQYRTGQVLDMARITAAGRAVGAVVGWDLAHAVGNVPLSLAEWDADFAVWCSYKYLCGGPGALAGAFVSERYRHATDVPRLAGWWGHDRQTRFEMGPQFVPMPGAEGWQLSNPPVLAMAPLAASLELFQSATAQRLRAKSLALTAFAHDLLDSRLAGQVECLTPRAPAARGCQLSLRLATDREAARRSFDALLARDVVGDWREPDVIRIAPHPLYNSYADVAVFVERLADVLESP